MGGVLSMIESRFRTKKEMVYSYLKDDILHGVIKPGTRLLLADIAHKYEVSEIPVREAVQMLIRENLLENCGGVGIQVKGFTRKDIIDIFQIRVELESLAMRLAVDNISNKQISRLSEIIEESRPFSNNLEFEEYFNKNREFHFAIYSICDNPRLVEIIANLYEISRRYPNWYTKKSEMEKSLREHEKIVDYLLKRDTDNAVNLIKKHTEDSCIHVIMRMDQESKC